MQCTFSFLIIPKCFQKSIKSFFNGLVYIMLSAIFIPGRSHNSREKTNLQDGINDPSRPIAIINQT